MEESLVQAEYLPPYASDLAKYERLYFWATLSTLSSGADKGGHEEGELAGVTSMDARPSFRPDVTVADFAYDVGEIEEALQKGHVPDEAHLTGGGCSIIFRPGTNTSGVQILRINTPTKTVLDFCNGRRTVSQIVMDTETALHAKDLHDSVVETINRLLASQVLALNAAGAAHASTQHRAYAGATQIESM
jgi:hypothetical protein